MTLEKIVMTPYNATEKTLSIIVERKLSLPDSDDVNYECKGQHAGLVINNPIDASSVKLPEPEMQLEFSCIMNNKESQETFVENRRLQFWFKDGYDHLKRLDSSYNFFSELISPEVFPKDYIGFVKRVMKLMQITKFMQLQRLLINFTRLDNSQQESIVMEKNHRPTEEVVRENIHMRLDEAFPNVMSMDDLIKTMNVDPNIIKIQLNDLIANDVIQEVKLVGKLKGQIGYRRNYPKVADEKIMEVKGQNHYLEVAADNNPTIAIITNLLCEKMAVDAMMTQKTTFVRYKSEGDSHVYTIGLIGVHKVISAKLPMVGRSMEAKISSANTTTRLLGAFQMVQHVFVIGTAGGVPHIYEFDKHSRLGDIVVSTAMSPSDNDYLYCDKVTYPDEDNPIESQVTFGLKYYKSIDATLKDHVSEVLDEYDSNPSRCSWRENIDEVQEKLKDQDIDFCRPPADTDKLKLKMGGGMTCDVKHPEIPQERLLYYPEGQPAVRLGVIGSGRPITENDTLRDSFAHEHHILAWDAEYDQVLESVKGNRKESFLFIHGIADYHDGSKEPLWQPYASLSAAAFMKAVINRIV